MADNAQIIWTFLKAQGLNDCGIAGLMGNLYAESGLQPNNLQNTYSKKFGLSDAEYTKRVDNGRYTNFVNDKAGYGLAQWTFWSRKQSLLEYAKAQKTSIGDLNMQLNFLMKELSQSYPSVLNTLRTASSVLEASNAVLLKFERPADQSAAVQQKRANFGQVYYDKYAIKSQTPLTGGTSMKYSATNKPLVCMQTNSTCYKQTRIMQPVGILWHSTGANNPKLSRYIQPLETDANYNEMITLLGKNKYNNDYNHTSHQSGLNCWIGKLADGSVTTVQSMPWNYRPWGCGSGPKGSCNNGWIQFEICEDGLTDPDYFAKVYKEACEITAYLCQMFNIDPHGTVMMNGVRVPTILCHADSCQLGLGSNHGDINHWFPKHGKSMETARNDVAALLNSSPITPVPEEEEEMTQEQFNQMMNNYLAELAKQPATWEQDACNWARQVGLMVGDETGNQMPKKFCTRGEMAVMLKRFAEIAKK